MDRFLRYLLIALVLVIPVQGVAAAVHAFSCGSNGSASVATAEHDGHEHESAGSHDHAAHDHDQHPGNATGDHAQHQCCHQVSAVPALHVSPAPADLPVYLSFPSVLDVTFVLEQPQRPPRA